MNRLAQQTSPYLLQHAGNPVDWYPWGDEALARADELNRPLLVSIGYSACHWCHVMAHESFEDEQTAALMNEQFVCVKVDREERPDIDAVCMTACQAMTGHGGWPLNVFLTPEQQPFFAGTYFPPDQRPGMPSWRMVLQAVSEAWRDRPEQVREQGARLAAAVSASAMIGGDAEEVVPRTVVSRQHQRARTDVRSRARRLGWSPEVPTALHARLPARRRRLRARAGDPARDGRGRHL